MARPLANRGRAHSTFESDGSSRSGSIPRIRYMTDVTMNADEHDMDVLINNFAQDIRGYRALQDLEMKQVRYVDAAGNPVVTTNVYMNQEKLRIHAMRSEEINEFAVRLKEKELTLHAFFASSKHKSKPVKCILRTFTIDLKGSTRPSIQQRLHWKLV